MKIKIMVVEDDLPNLKLLEEILTQSDYQVVKATDGSQAMELVQRKAPDLAIVDVMLPTLNGFEVCQRIRAIPEFSAMPIIILTVLNEPHHRIRATEAGATDFLSKPFDRMELLTKIKSLLSIRNEFIHHEHFEDIIFCLLLALEKRNSLIVNHSRRVAKLSEQFSIRWGLPVREVNDVRDGALLHDIGKLALDIPLELYSEENNEIKAETLKLRKNHTIFGDQMLARFHRPIVRQIARSHHELLSGGGFPDGLKGAQINMPVRIVAICNRFDFLTEGNWSNADRVSKSLQTMQKEVRAGSWDQDMFKELTDLVNIYLSLPPSYS